MDVLKALEEKAFFGHEFLTWLWFRSETSGGDLELDAFGPITLWIDDRIVLGSLDTESKENILKDGDVSRSGEAAAALKLGKKLQQARFGLICDDREFSFVLDGATLAVQSAAIPRVLAERGEDWQPTALVRLGHIWEILDVIDALFAEFLGARTTDLWVKEVLPEMERWVTEKEGG